MGGVVLPNPAPSSLVPKCVPQHAGCCGIGTSQKSPHIPTAVAELAGGPIPVGSQPSTRSLLQSEYHYEYTACDSAGARWRVAVPHTPGLCTGLPDPVKGTECCKVGVRGWPGGL